MCAGQHGGRADKAEVPADAQQDQRDIKVLKLHALQGHDASQTQNGDADAHDLFDAKARNQVAGEKGRREHRQHVTCHDIPGLRLIVSTPHNGQRRGGHHKVHQRIRYHRTDHRDRDARRCNQLPTGAALGAVCGGNGRFGDVDEKEQD